MSKDPSFLFYTQDFLTGTYFMTDEQVGKYIRLLCLQHQTGHLNKEDMLHICKTYDKKVFSKFEQDENGLYFNERLELEVNRRIEYCKTRRENRLSKITYVKHMENEDEDIKKKEEYEEKKEFNSDGYITPNMFNKFWLVYPRKDGKGKALTKWNSICTKGNKRPKWIEIKKAILLQIKSERWQNSEFIPLPATWLNQTRWIDDPKEMKNFNREEEVTCPYKFKFGTDHAKFAGCDTCEDEFHKTWAQCKRAYSNQ